MSFIVSAKHGMIDRENNPQFKSVSTERFNKHSYAVNRYLDIINTLEDGGFDILEFVGQKRSSALKHPLEDSTAPDRWILAKLRHVVKDSVEPVNDIWIVSLERV